MLLLRHIFVAVPSTAGDEARESARNSEVMITAEGAGAISGKIPCSINQRHASKVPKTSDNLSIAGTGTGQILSISLYFSLLAGR